MSEEKTYTEAEVRRRERRAFVAGANWWELARRSYAGVPSDEALRRYPITKKVPRVWREPSSGGIEWTVRPNGHIGYISGYTSGGGNVIEPNSCTLTPARIEAWAELLANPFEEIEE